jgi:PPIC-type PPIASE domain
VHLVRSIKYVLFSFHSLQAQGSRMTRTVYTDLVCAAGFVVATLWLQPVVAEDSIDLSKSVRAQSPGVAAATPQSADLNALPAWNGQPGTAPYGYMPIAPTQPMPATRPATWPGAPLEVSPANPVANSYAPPPGIASPNTAAPMQPNPYGTPPQQQPFNVAPAAGATPDGSVASPQANTEMQSLQVLPGPRQDFDDGRVVATVGSVPILAGDVKGMINQAIRNKMIPEPPPGQEEMLYQMAMRPVLKQMVEMKLVVNDAKQTIPAAGLGKIEAEMNREFDKLEVPRLMEMYKVSSQHDLDDALRQTGSSLDWERRSYFERNLFLGWRQQQFKGDEVVPLANVVGYYQEHLLDYEYPAQARWEEIMVSSENFPDKAAAYAAIAQMGNQLMQGAPFADVAKSGSQGPTSDKGGVHDWTTKGSLACKALDEALFTLPVGTLSQIIESERGFHIIRVVERKDAGKKSFEDAQADIKKQLREDIRKKQLDKYLAELHKKTPVWTIFSDQPGGLDGPKQEEEHHF